ncbi:MAG: tetratricopeptide repeat protein [Ignavibacteriae bacterium]|nr:tetratricopeptide repeat protein [Ignavibacteriota bacterium]
MIKIILFLFATVCFGQSFNNYHNLVERSDRLIYNYEFEKAIDLLNSAIEKKRERPEAFLILSKIYLWYYLGSSNSSDLKLFENYADSVISKCNNIIDDNNDINILYLLGNIYKYKAMMSAANANSLDAFWATKTSVGFYEDVLEIDSTYYSAQGGIGIFEYALTYVPSFFSWALTFTGLSADDNNGFELVKKAYYKGKKDKIELQFHLAKLYDEYLADYKSAIKLLDPLVEEFPQNNILQYQRAIEFIKSKNLNKAKIDLEEILKNGHPKFSQTISFTKFLLGDVYFRQNNFEKALEYYQQFLQTTKTIDYTGIASLRAAICNHFLDNQNEFRKYAVLASNGNQDIEDDNYAKELSLKFLENGLNKEWEFQIKIENLYLAGNNKKVIESVNEIVDTIESEEIKSLLLNYKTSSLIELNKFSDAKKIANQLKNYDLQSSFWIKPMAYVNLAKINMAEKKYSAAKQYVQAVSEIDNYSRKNQIKSYLNKIKIDLKGKKL